MPPSSFRRRAFSLIEVVIALGVVAVAVLALIGLMGSTFGTAREVALQHKAINAFSALDGALQNPRSIAGLSPDITKPAFDQVFRALQPLDDRTPTDFLVFLKTKVGTVGKGALGTAAVPAVVKLTGPTPTLDTINADGADTTGKATYSGAETDSFFRLRVRVSPLMKGKLYQLDPATYEPRQTTWNGGSVGTDPDQYALAYLPLIVDIYPVDLSNPDGTDPDKNTQLTPVFSQTLVINR